MAYTNQSRPETRYARSGDVSIAYQVFGRGPTTMVLVLGWVSNVDLLWEEETTASFLNRLASFCRVITFDKRGTGQSDRAVQMPDLETRMDDVRAVMDAIACRSASIFGSSEGGSMAALFAATFPERTDRLILHAAFPRLTRAPDYPLGRTEEAQQATIAYVKENWGKAIGIERRIPSMAQDSTYREWFARVLRHSASPADAIALMRMNAEIDIRDILSSIKVPTLLLHSSNDEEFSIEHSRYMAKRIPNSRLIELTGFDHIPTGDDSTGIVEAVEVFMTGASHTADAQEVLKTLLFTDIVDSTATASRLGDLKWTELLSRHHHVVRQQLIKYRGQELDTAGDGFMAAFDGPARAVRCACSILEQVRSLGISLRAGVHTGECEVFGNKFAGLAVHIAARVVARADANQVLVTSTVKDLVAGSQLSFSDCGIASLKGIPGEWRLFAAA
jgi:pimeloyl-ACP methyl ester carboxylesterase/class 3 adenylate cyclase